MKVLVVGGGGREHALCRKIAESPRLSRLFCAPGNPGIARIATCVPVRADDVAGIVAFARQEGIDLVVVGPELPLALGLADALEAEGIPCFGPKRAAAEIESSKSFAKGLMQRAGIPTAAHGVFTAPEEALAFAARYDGRVAVKADGLAAGKGVIVCGSMEEARAAVEAMLVQGAFGEAGAKVVIEERLEGPEASVIALVDGKSVALFEPAQDHKRLLDGDRGPNTGGMGAYSPAPVVTPELHARIMREVIEPTLQGLAADGTPYTGFLYAGLMIAPDGTPNVLEYNCRFGDPETQPILMRLESDLTELCEAALDGRLDAMRAEWDPRAALGVVMAAQGYPDAVRRGDVIEGLEQAARLPGKVFHAGTRLENGKVVTNGGRVLCAVGLGATVAEAQRQAYALCDVIRWPGMHYRRDIGHRAIARERAARGAGPSS